MQHPERFINWLVGGYRPSPATPGRTSRDLGAQVESRATEEHAVVGDKGDPPPDGGGSNPEIAVVLLLMKRMADKPAIVPEASHPVDRLDVDRQGPGSSDQPVELPESRGALGGDRSGVTRRTPAIPTRLHHRRRSRLIILVAAITIGGPALGQRATAEIGPGDPPSTFTYLRSGDGGSRFTPMQLNDVEPETYRTHMKAHDGVVHAVFDTVEQPRQVHYRRSTDGGSSFSRSIRLDNNVGDSSESTFAVEERTIHVVWEDDRLLPNGDIDPCCEKPFTSENRDEIFYARSIDGGKNFSDPVNLTDAPDVHNRDPDVTVDGDLVALAYEGVDLGADPDNEDDEVLFRRSLDGGRTWEPEVNLTNDPGEQDEPAVAVSGKTVHVAFRDKASGSLGYTRSTNGAKSFAPFVTLPGPAEESDVLALGTTVYIATCTVSEDEGGPFALALHKSTDDGASFEGPITIADLEDECGEPTIDGVGDRLHITFDMDSKAGTSDVFHVHSDDRGRRWTKPVNLSNNHESSGDSSVSVDPQHPDSVHISWVDSSTFLFALRFGQELPLADGDEGSFANEDVIRYVGGAYEMILDGSDVGLGKFRIDALATLSPEDEGEPATQFVLSFSEPGEVPGVGWVDDSDLVLFTADRLGKETSGRFSMYLDGSAIGLHHSSEDIDAVEIEVTDDGIDIYMSTEGSFGIGKLRQGKGTDVFVCRGATTGETSACEEVEKVFDGREVGLSAGAGRIDAFSFDGLGNTNEGSAFFSTAGPFSLSTAKGGSADILQCRFTEEDEEDGTVDTSLEDCGGDQVPLLSVFSAHRHGLEENITALEFEY